MVGKKYKKIAIMASIRAPIPVPIHAVPHIIQLLLLYAIHLHIPLLSNTKFYSWHLNLLFNFHGISKITTESQGICHRALSIRLSVHDLANIFPAVCQYQTAHQCPFLYCCLQLCIPKVLKYASTASTTK
jgi:hypothetical protein